MSRDALLTTSRLPARGDVPDHREVAAFCQGRLVHFKVPRHVLFVDEFPLTVTGKVQKYMMRK